MKNILVAIFCSAAMASVSLSTIAAPRIEVDTIEWDVGEVEQGESEEREFVVTNAGDEVLKIKNIESDCPCITFPSIDKEIEPGKSGKVRVVFNATGLAPMKFQKYVYITSNDPKTTGRGTVLTVKGRVTPVPEPKLWIEEWKRDIGVVRQGERKVLEYDYENKGSAELEVEPLFFLDEEQFELVEDISEKKLKRGQHGKFKIAFNAEKLGRVDAFFLVKWKNPETPDTKKLTKCKIEGYVIEKEKGISISEPMLKPKAEGEPETKVSEYLFNITNHNPYSVEVAMIQGDVEGEKVVIESGKSSELTAEVSDESALKSISFKVNILLSSEEPEEPVEEKAEPEAEKPETTEGELTTEKEKEGEREAEEKPTEKDVEDVEKERETEGIEE